MLYAAKCYWPQVTAREVELAAGKAIRGAEVASRTGAPVGYVGSMLFPDDDLVLCLFESSAATAVNQANDRAGGVNAENDRETRSHAWVLSLENPRGRRFRRQRPAPLYKNVHKWK